MSENLIRRFWEAATTARPLTGNLTKQSEWNFTYKHDGLLRGLSIFGLLIASRELVRFKVLTFAREYACLINTSFLKHCFC